jgi:hypothetical protein
MILLADFSIRPARCRRSFSEPAVLKCNVSHLTCATITRKWSGKVKSPSVHGWLQCRNPVLPPMEVGNEVEYYPRAPRLAKDAVNVAIQNGVQFESSLDNQSGIIARSSSFMWSQREVMPWPCARTEIIRTNGS